MRKSCEKHSVGLCLVGAETGVHLRVDLSALCVSLLSIDVVCGNFSDSCLCPNKLEKKALNLPFLGTSRLFPRDRLGGDSRLASIRSTRSG